MNILQLGLDVDTFSEEKRARLESFVSVFETLSKYDGKVINPVMGEGLVALNNSIASTSKLIDELNVKLNTLGSQRQQANSSGQVDELSLAMKEYSKSADQAATISAKLAVAQSEQAKQTMALKLQLSDVTKELIAQASVQETSIQQRINSINGIQSDTKNQAENNAMKLQAVNALRALAVEQDRQEKAAAKNNAKAQIADEKRLKEEEQQRVAALRAVIAQEELDAKAKLAEDKATKQLISDYAILKRSLQDQAAAYQNLYINSGKNSPETKAALNQYATTAAVVNDISTQLNKAGGNGEKFSKVLGGMFGQLRTLAYILPGIGIAGLFNLAFEAIGKAIESLGIFNDDLERQIELEHELTKNLNEQIALREKIYGLSTKFNDEVSGNSALNFRREADAFKSRGYDEDATARVDIEAAKKELAEAQSKFIPGDEKRIAKLLEDQVVLLRSITKLQDAISDPNFEKQKLNQGLEEVKKSFNVVDPSAFTFKLIRSFGKSYTDLTKEQVDRLKEQLNLAVSDAQDKIGKLSDINSKQSNVVKLENEYIKQLEDERRKVQTETAKENLSVNIAKNQSIVNDQRSTEKEVISSLKRIRDYTRQANFTDYKNVKDDKSSTAGEIEIAKNKLLGENKKADLKYQDDLLRQETEFYQRRLKATTEITKSQLDEEAIKNEKIYKNEQRSYQERIDAYNKYVVLRQQIQQLEFNKDIQRGANKVGGKTSLTPEEGAELLRQTNTQRVNIQADAENQIYSIIKESVNRQVQLVVQQNKLEEEKNNQAYASSLDSLNKNFEKRRLSYEQYRKSRLEIDRKYTTQSLDAEIEDDLKELDRLGDLLAKIETNLKFATQKRENAEKTVSKDQSKGVKDLDNIRERDEAIGAERALADAVLGIRTKIVDKTNELEDDRLKRAKQRYQLLEQYNREHAQNMAAIEEGLYNLVRTYVDGQYEARQEALEKNKQVTDENYDAQSAAIERSSLDAKNKAALDIQLAQQKKEFDKNADADARKLKHDQAVFDRELTLAHIAWETEQAIMAALATSWIDPISAQALAIERGILGAIAAATVLATPIPSYAEGTTNHPGGLARFGEDGIEAVKEPYKSPYLVFKETISYLPKGTEVIPISKDPTFIDNLVKDESWDQTRWLAQQMRKNKQEIKNIINPVVKIDFKTEAWRRNILGN